MEKNHKQTKKELFELKNLANITEKDYRAFLAIMIWTGYLLLIALCVLKGDIDMCEKIGLTLTPVVSSITTFYFVLEKKKNNNNNNSEE